MYLPKSQQKQQSAEDSPASDANGNAIDATSVIATAFGTFFKKDIPS